METTRGGAKDLTVVKREHEATAAARNNDSRNLIAIVSSNASTKHSNDVVSVYRVSRGMLEVDYGLYKHAEGEVSTKLETDYLLTFQDR